MWPPSDVLVPVVRDDESIRCLQLFFSALDSAVVSSGMLDKRSIYHLSEECHTSLLIVRQRLKHVSGEVVILDGFRQRFPGARELAVIFKEVPTATTVSQKRYGQQGA